MCTEIYNRDKWQRFCKQSFNFLSCSSSYCTYDAFTHTQVQFTKQFYYKDIQYFHLHTLCNYSTTSGQLLTLYQEHLRGFEYTVTISIKQLYWYLYFIKLYFVCELLLLFPCVLQYMDSLKWKIIWWIFIQKFDIAVWFLGYAKGKITEQGAGK